MTIQKKTIKYTPKRMTVTLKRDAKAPKVPPEVPLYEKDFFDWTTMQASLLKKGEYKKLDIDHLVEEIEALGRSERRTLESHLANLFLHLLKIKYQPGKHTRSWDLSIKNADYHAKKVYQQNPSLKQHLPDIFADAYYTAKLKACDETGLEEDVFPEKCPWKVKDIL